MNCTLGQAGLGQQTVALCSISRCRVTKQELKASRKHIRNLFNTVKVKKKIRWISELDLILQFFWHKTTFFSFSNSNWRETPDEYLLGKVVFCFSIQCTFPQIRTSPNEKFCTCPIVVFVHRTPRICEVPGALGAVNMQYLCSIFFKRRRCKTLFYIH